MSIKENKKLYVYVVITFDCLANFCTLKTKIWITTVKYQGIATKFQFFEISQIVSKQTNKEHCLLFNMVKMPTKANFKHLAKTR